MNLQEFVQTTLEQIAAGVKSARPKVEGAGATIHGNVEWISFDVALTVAEGQSGGVDGGLAVAGFRIGGKGESENSSTSVSRVAFRVMLEIPDR